MRNIKDTTCKRTGFTLIEVLIVIGIIALLVAVLVPSVRLAIDYAKTSKTQGSINMISGGITMYANDFGDEFPPTDSDARDSISNGGYGLDSGAKIVCALLTGYADDTGTKGEAGDDEPANRWRLDDGKDGMGYRTKKRGKVRGPYNGCETIPMSPDMSKYHDGSGGDKSARVFIDAWDNPILYYRANDSGNKFDKDDNDNESVYPDQNYLDNNDIDQTPEEFLILTPGTKSSYSDFDDAVSNIKE